jgi:hypothetical protein
MNIISSTPNEQEIKYGEKSKWSLVSNRAIIAKTQGGVEGTHHVNRQNVCKEAKNAHDSK